MCACVCVSTTLLPVDHAMRFCFSFLLVIVVVVGAFCSLFSHLFRSFLLLSEQTEERAWKNGQNKCLILWIPQIWIFACAVTIGLSMRASARAWESSLQMHNTLPKSDWLSFANLFHRAIIRMKLLRLWSLMKFLQWKIWRSTFLYCKCALRNSWTVLRSYAQSLRAQLIRKLV